MKRPSDLERLQAAKDDAAVDMFAARMKARMAAGRLRGRDGWDGPGPEVTDRIRDMLIGCMSKSDGNNFEDIALLAMMLRIRDDVPLALAEDFKAFLESRDLTPHVEAKISEIEEDERLHYRAASVFSNAPLALIQSNMTSTLDVLYNLLGKTRPKYKCDKE